MSWDKIKISAPGGNPTVSFKEDNSTQIVVMLTIAPHLTNLQNSTEIVAKQETEELTAPLCLPR